MVRTILLVLCIFGGSVDTALACDSMAPLRGLSLTKGYKASDLIFLGVWKREEGRYSDELLFEVKQVFKGYLPSPTLKVRVLANHFSNCEEAFGGEPVLIFLSAEKSGKLKYLGSSAQEFLKEEIKLLKNPQLLERAIEDEASRERQSLNDLAAEEARLRMKSGHF